MLAQKLALSYTSRILLQFIQVAVTIVVARIAGPSVLGTIAFGMAFVNMFAFIADLGIPTAYIKSYNDGDNEAEANGTFLRIQFALTGIFFFVVLSWLLIQKYGFHYHFESKTHEYVIIVFLIAITIQRLFQGVKTLFIARTQQAKQDMPDLIQALIYQAIRLTIVLLGYKALAIAFSNLSATVIIIPFYIYLLKPYQFGKFNKLLAIKYFKISIPLTVILVANYTLANADKVMLQYFSDSKIVGYYTAGFRIGGFIQMIAGVIGLLFFPLFTNAIAKDDIAFINDKINKFERFMFAFVFPVTVFMAIYSDMIVKIVLGNKYLPTIPILSVITISMFFLTLFQPYGNVILAKGKFFLSAMIFLVKLLLFISIAFFVVNPVYFNGGGLGMAVVIFIIELLTGISFVIFTKKSVPNIIVIKSYKLIIFSISISLLTYIFYKLLPNGITIKLIYGFSFFIIFWSVGYLFRIINKEDWEMLYNVVNIGKMKNYIRKEIFNR